MKEKLKNLLLDNWGLKLISLVLAFVLWFVVISIDDPVKDKTLTNIKVDLINTEELTQKGMVWEVLDGTDVLRSVTFDAPLSVREVIQPSDIIAEADLGEITVADTVAIEFSCPKYSGQVTNISGNISNVKLSVEEKASKWIDIKYNLIGEVASGYVIGGVTLEQNRLEIEGPQSKIAEVARAVVDVNVAGVSGNNMSIRVDVHLRDAEGNEVEYPTITKNTDTVRVTVDIYSTKEVPIEFQTTGIPAEGYLATGDKTVSPEKVLIAGPGNLLSKVSKITIPAKDIDITGATGNLEQMLNLKDYLSSGIYLADDEFDGKVYATVFVEAVAEKKFSLEKDQIAISNVPEGYVVNFPENINLPTVTVLGLQKDLENISSITGTIDVEAWMETVGMEEMTSGMYTLPVTIEVSEEYSLKDDLAVYLEFATPEELAERALAEVAEEVQEEIQE